MAEREFPGRTRGRVHAGAVVALLAALGLIAFLRWPDPGTAVDVQASSPRADSPSSEKLTPSTRVESLRSSAARPAGTEPSADVAASTSHILRVRTVDTADRPLAGARLYVRDDRGSRPIGTTDASGRASIPLPDDPWLEIAARKQDFAVANAVVQRPAPDECVLRLSAATTISGTVVFEDKQPAGEDLVVLALPEHRLRVLSDAPERVWDEPEVAETRTDHKGKFTLSDLNPARRYVLVAGGQGFVQQGPVGDIPPGATDAELVVDHGWAARIELRGAQGAAPHTKDVFGTGIGATAGLIEREAHFVRHARLYALLSGVPIEPAADPSDLVYVAGAPRSASGVTLQLHTHPPGFALVRSDVPLTRLSHGMPTERIQITQVAAGFGTIEIERVGGAPLAQADTRHGPFAVLTLYRDEGLPWHYRLFDSRVERQRVENVPFGKYRAVYRLMSSRAMIPAADEAARSIEVGPSPTVLRYDGTQLGAIEFDARAADGSSREGELTVFLGAGTYDPKRPGQEQEFNGEALFFRRAPYVIDNLPATPHSFHVSPGVAGPDWHSVGVEPGQIKTVRITVP
jgi:hypothetical protein